MRARALLLTAILISLPSAASADPFFKLGLGAAHSRGDGDTVTPFDFKFESVQVGALMSLGRNRSPVNYRLAVDYWDGRFDLEDGQFTRLASDGGGGGGGFFGGGGGGGGPTVERADQPFRGVLTTHSLALRPGRNRFWVGPSFYFGRIRADAEQRGENAGAGSFTVGYGLSLGVDLGREAPFVALELGYRHLESELTDIGQSSADEDRAEFDDVVMRLSVLFGRAAAPSSALPPAAPPVEVVPPVY